eukprot:jgi/Galph1/2255/GphlegSOOS_G962.1
MPVGLPPTLPQNRKVGEPFSTFADSLVIRNWQPKDRLLVKEIVQSALSEHGLAFDPLDTDKDVLEVEEHYGTKGGELWVLEQDGTVVGCGAFIPWGNDNSVEFRKLYFSPCLRGKGYGRLLLTALEHRAFQLGYRIGRLETSGLLTAAKKLYERMGYHLCSHYEQNKGDWVYWLDTEGRLFSLLEKRDINRYHVLGKQWRLSLQGPNNIICVFEKVVLTSFKVFCDHDNSKRKKLFQLFWWGPESPVVSSTWQKYKTFSTEEPKIILFKCQLVTLPASQHVVFIQVCEWYYSKVVALSEMETMTTDQIENLSRSIIDEEDAFVWNMVHENPPKNE